MNAALRQELMARANGRCEYCQLPLKFDRFGGTVDHIRAQYHHGQNEADNLCMSCMRCNVQKGTNLSGFDTASGDVIPLFHPRTDAWMDHFVLDYESGEIAGITPTGKVTVDVLRMNDPRRCFVRRQLISEGVW